MTREEALEKIKAEIRMYEEESLESVEWEECYEALKQEPILDKIFCMVYPLSIMSTQELEHKAIMQIAEMLEPLCLSERR